MDTSFLAVRPRDRFELFDRSPLDGFAGSDVESATNNGCAGRSTTLTARGPDYRARGSSDRTTLDPDGGPDEDLPEPDEDGPDEDGDNGTEPSREEGGAGDDDDLGGDERATTMTANEFGHGCPARRDPRDRATGELRSRCEVAVQRRRAGGSHDNASLTNDTMEGTTR